MFDLFGEFNSAEEINIAAAGQLSQGDIEAIMKLAKENGIDEGMAQYYIEGSMPYLCDDMTADIGKLEVEMSEVKEPGMKESIDAFKQYLESECLDDAVLARKIRLKGKRLQDAVAQIRKEAESRIKQKSGMVCVHVPPAEAFAILKDYYDKPVTAIKNAKKEESQIDKEQPDEDTDQDGDENEDE